MTAFNGLLGNRADHHACTQMKALWKKLREGAAEPRNCDLARTIRRSQLLALKLGVRVYRDLPHQSYWQHRTFAASDIAEPLTAWIDAQLKTAGTATTDHTVRQIEDRIEQAFTFPTPEETAATQRQQELCAIALDWTLPEAKAIVPSAKDWDRFAALLRDGATTPMGHYPGWFPIFRAFLAEEVKCDDRVQRILAEQGIAKLLHLQTDLAAAMGTLQKGMEDLVTEMRGALNALREATLDIANAAERIEQALPLIDQGFDRIISMLVRIEAGVQRLPEQVRTIVDDGNRYWHGVPLNRGQADAVDTRMRDRPTELLIARYRIVEFLDRGDFLRDLLAWVTDRAGRRAQGRLYVAPGGFGKTRLGIELLAELDGMGWRVTFLSQMNAEHLAAGTLPDLLRAGDVPGICVVVDYAEGPTQRQRLRDLANAAAMAEASGPPIRIVAFARSAAGWWDDFAGKAGPVDVFDPAPFSTLDDKLTPDDCHALFVRSRATFVQQLRRLGLTCREPGVVPALTGADRPLIVAALAFLDARGVELKGRSVFQTLYEQERQHWQRVLSVGADDEIDDLARAAAQITLVQGATAKGATALMQADPTERSVSVANVLIALRRLYGHMTEGGEADFIGPIEPDLLGEHAAMAMAARTRNALVGPTLTAALRGAPLFAQNVGLMLTVLTRATRPEHDTRTQEAARSATDHIAHMVAGLPPDHAERLAAALPRDSVALRELAAVLARRLVDLATDPKHDGLASRAGRLNNLGNSLSDLGRREAALAAAEEAVKLYRALVDRNRDAFLPDLARALNNLGIRLSALGRREAALAAAEEAVKLYRELVDRNRDAFLPDLASALNNLGNMLSDLGRRETALAAAEEAVKLYRELVDRNRDAFLPDLAMALNNLGNRLSDLGRREVALAATEEAVRLHRELVDRNRDAFLPELARVLGGYGQILLAADRPDDATAVFQEGAQLLRPLAEALPAAFGGLSQALVGGVVAALRAAGREAEIPAKLDALGVERKG